MFVAILQSLLFIFLVLLSLFLILIILLQRGKGGGLVGAFGGMGGNSAFGAKTTDVFLRITIWTAIIWFVTCFAGSYLLNLNSTRSLADQASTDPAAVATAPQLSGDNATTGDDATTADSATTSHPATEEAPATDAEPAQEGNE
ncbi:MAG: preprotein translocase subunit SecG [Planctomycetia bacterium]|nr:preprotein translocase subunit SecG [Planctomycetia bacterium]